MTINDLRKEKIALLGLSTEGISTAEFLFRHAIPFTILEMHDLQSLGDRNKLLEKWNVPAIVGEDHRKHIADYSLIFRSPGVPLFLPELSAARQNGSIISSNTKLFMVLTRGHTIGVTGTKGKGTTTMLIASILKSQGIAAFIGGNIGVPPLNFIDDMSEDDFAILELSSFQLEDFEKSPEIAVILGLAPDHLAPESPDAPNYHSSVDAYYEAKKQLIIHQKNSDRVILNADDEIVRGFSDSTPAEALYFSRTHKVSGSYIRYDEEIILNMHDTETLIGNTTDLKLAGRHNWFNICAAIATSAAVGCSVEAIRRGIFSFSGYEHRLEFVQEINGVRFFDDSAATNPDPCIAAIQAFDSPIVLIAGGSDKGQSYTELGKVIAGSTVKAVYLIGDMAHKIAEAINSEAGFKGKIIMADKTPMAELVQTCHSRTKAGDIVLLSPACASFDMFKNYKDRGNQFKAAVKNLEIQ